MAAILFLYFPSFYPPLQMFIHSLLAYCQEKKESEFSGLKNNVHLSFIQEKMVTDKKGSTD